MGICLREADVVQDEGVLVALGQKYLPAMNPARFRWLYQQNPFGAARVWLATDEKSNEPVGMASVFPRRGYVRGAEVLGCVLGDFCISENYRSLGPAVKLQRASLSSVKNGDFAFYYDFPSSRMAAIYKYLGVAEADRSIRMVKFLKADAALRRLVPLQRLSGAISRGANQALALRERLRATDNGTEYRLDDRSCAAEFAELAARVGSSLGDCTVRTPDYLNWRFRQHPSLKYEVLTAHRGGKLQGYCFFAVEQDEAYVSDLFGTPEPETTRVLMAGLLGELYRREVSAISVSVLASDPRVPVLKKLGFWGRESVPVISSGPNRFLLMHGDRES